MKRIDRIREKVTIPPTSVYLSKMHDAGWRLVALEWEREIEFSGEPEPPVAEAGAEEIPFGLRIASDCRHLKTIRSRHKPSSSWPRWSSRTCLSEAWPTRSTLGITARATGSPGTLPASSGLFPA